MSLMGRCRFRRHQVATDFTARLSVVRAASGSSFASFAIRLSWYYETIRIPSDLPSPLRLKNYLALLVRTAETDPHQLGFAFARWTCARLAAYLQQRTGLQVKPQASGEHVHLLSNLP